MTNSQIKIDEILGMLTIRLGDKNYSKLANQFSSVLRVISCLTILMELQFVFPNLLSILIQGLQ